MFQHHSIIVLHGKFPDQVWILFGALSFFSKSRGVGITAFFIPPDRILLGPKNRKLILCSFLGEKDEKWEIKESILLGRLDVGNASSICVAYIPPS